MSNTLIIIPTYNEKENIKSLTAEIFKHASEVNVLIVDDNSPDGTGKIADNLAKRDSRVSVVHRMSKRGRGTAGIDGFREALQRKDVAYIMEMDADFSHDPRYIPDFLDEVKYADVIIGSRFIEGGKDIERNFFRNFLSRIANFFIRGYLGLKIKDCSSGYRCFKASVIASLDIDSFISKGPAIIEEGLFVSNTKGFKIKEIPILFKRRHCGKTKLNFLKLLGVFVDILIFRHLHTGQIRIRELREFGFRFALALNILGFIMFYRERAHFIWFSSIGSVNFVLAILWPTLLMPLKKALDLLIVFIGKATNLVTMTLAFYLIFAPIAIFLRIFRIDILDEKIDRSKKSYWIGKKRIASSPQRYERMG